MPRALQTYNMEDTIEEVIYIRLVVPGPFLFSFRPAMYLMNLKSCHPLVSVICSLFSVPVLQLSQFRASERITEETDNCI